MQELSRPRQRPVKLKSIALPSEHGGWGFLAEPILLGGLVAFSWSGVLVGIAAVGVFLIHQPLKIALKDRKRTPWPPRTVWAIRFAAGYALLALIPMIVLLLSLRPSRAFVLPLVLAIPFAIIQLYYDSRNRSRWLVPEVAGALALALVAPAIAMLAGWSFWMALPLWVLLGLRATVSILFIRSRIRLRVGKEANVTTTWMVHGLALVVVMALALTSVVPWLTAVPFGILLGRSLKGLSRFRKEQPIKAIGFQELAYGLLTVFLIAAGYLFF